MENRPNEHPELSNEEIDQAARMEEEATASHSKKVVVELDEYLFNSFIKAYNYGQPPQLMLKANIDYTIKDIKIIDDFFKDDARHSELKKAASKAYKQLKEYEFNTRNK